MSYAYQHTTVSRNAAGSVEDMPDALPVLINSEANSTPVSHKRGRMTEAILSSPPRPKKLRGIGIGGIIPNDDFTRLFRDAQDKINALYGDAPQPVRPADAIRGAQAEQPSRTIEPVRPADPARPAFEPSPAPSHDGHWASSAPREVGFTSARTMPSMSVASHLEGFSNVNRDGYADTGFISPKSPAPLSVCSDKMMDGEHHCGKANEGHCFGCADESIRFFVKGPSTPTTEVSDTFASATAASFLSGTMADLQSTSSGTIDTPFSDVSFSEAAQSAQQARPAQPTSTSTFIDIRVCSHVMGKHFPMWHASKSQLASYPGCAPAIYAGDDYGDAEVMVSNLFKNLHSSDGPSFIGTDSTMQASLRVVYLAEILGSPLAAHFVLKTKPDLAKGLKMTLNETLVWLYIACRVGNLAEKQEIAKYLMFNFSQVEIASQAKIPGAILSTMLPVLAPAINSAAEAASNLAIAAYSIAAATVARWKALNCSEYGCVDETIAEVEQYFIADATRRDGVISYSADVVYKWLQDESRLLSVHRLSHDGKCFRKSMQFELLVLELRLAIKNFGSSE